MALFFSELVGYFSPLTTFVALKDTSFVDNCFLGLSAQINFFRVILGPLIVVNTDGHLG